MTKGMKVFVFNAKEGITREFKSTTDAEKFYGVKGMYRALKLKRPIYSQYFALDYKPGIKEELSFYTKYCDKYIDKNVEVWANTRFEDLQISNLGRVKKRGVLAIPRLEKFHNHLYTYGVKGEKIKIATLVAECFILNRRFKKHECVFLKGSRLDTRACMLQVGTKKEISKKAITKTSHYTEVALLEDGQVKEIYKSIREAGRQNFIDYSGIAKAMKEDRPILGMVFKKLEEVQGW